MTGRQLRCQYPALFSHRPHLQPLIAQRPGQVLDECGLAA